MKNVVFTLLMSLVLGACADIPNHLGLSGKDGKDGSRGEKGDVGANGADGATGAQGVAGAAGQNGTNGTQITIVQLCGSCVGAYPATFPEVGLCIAGSLYGVYSANGGFMVKLSNGSYSSQGINCTCSFTISGCNVL